MNDAWDLSVLSLQLPVNLYLLQNKKFKEKKKKRSTQPVSRAAGILVSHPSTPTPQHSSGIT